VITCDWNIVAKQIINYFNFHSSRTCHNIIRNITFVKMRWMMISVPRVKIVLMDVKFYLLHVEEKSNILDT
jgi:hypothetical protein